MIFIVILCAALLVALAAACQMQSEIELDRRYGVSHPAPAEKPALPSGLGEEIGDMGDTAGTAEGAFEKSILGPP